MKETTPTLATTNGSEATMPFVQEHDPISIGARYFADSRLFTATLSLMRQHDDIHVFHACHAFSRQEVVEGLGSRIPARHLAIANIREGIDPDDAVVRRIVPDAVARMLAESGDCCPRRRPLSIGGVLHVIEHVQRARPFEPVW